MNYVQRARARSIKQRATGLRRIKRRKYAITQPYQHASRWLHETWWPAGPHPFEQEGGDWLDDEDDAACPRCHGDGMDPWCDYVLPCPICDGDDL